MTYHHLNRFIAHTKNIKLNKGERLLAWHLAYQIREKNSKFSTATRSLAKDLALDRRNIQKDLSYLIELGLFSRERGSNNQADKYRLLVSCPLNCEDLKIHNTKREIEIIERDYLTALNCDTPKGGGVFTPLLSTIYANRELEREEEEGFEISQEKVKVLGLIKQTLKDLKPEAKLEPHYTLLALTDLNPNAITKAVFELFAAKELDTWKRQAGYLKTTIERTPEALLTYAEEEGLIELGTATNSQLETSQTAITADPYLIEHNHNRLRTFINETIRSQVEKLLKEPELTDLWQVARNRGAIAEALEGGYKWQICDQVIFSLVEKGKLTDFYVQRLFELEQVLLNTCHLNAVRPNFRILFNLQADWENSYLGYLPNDHAIFTNIDFLLSEEDLARQNARRDAIEAARQNFILEENLTEATFSQFKFFTSKHYKEADQLHPEPASHEELILRWKSQIGILFALAKEAFIANDPSISGKNYSNWLQENFTWLDDYKDFREQYPPRPEGFKDNNQTRAAFKRVRKLLDQYTLLARVEQYKKSLRDKYPEQAGNFLARLETELAPSERAKF